MNSKKLLQKAIKEVSASVDILLVKGYIKALGLKERCVKSKESNNLDCQFSPKRGHLKKVFQICFLLMFGIFIFHPEYGFAKVDDISDIKTLTKKVQDDAQGYFIPMVLNAAGIAVAGFALISQRWTMLMFGAAYLVFVNVFFGFVNGSFKVS